MVDRNRIWSGDEFHTRVVSCDLRAAIIFTIFEFAVDDRTMAALILICVMASSRRQDGHMRSHWVKGENWDVDEIEAIEWHHSNRFNELCVRVRAVHLIVESYTTTPNQVSDCSGFRPHHNTETRIHRSSRMLGAGKRRSPVIRFDSCSQPFVWGIQDERIVLNILMGARVTECIFQSMGKTIFEVEKIHCSRVWPSVRVKCVRLDVFGTRK